MNMKSYEGQVFIIEDNDTRIRRADNLSMLETYQEDDALPEGKEVGDFKVIPKRTEIFVTDTRIDDDRNTFIFAQPTAANAVCPSGWTKAANLEGRFMNELIGLAPSVWDLPPLGSNCTVTNSKALLREGAPNFASKGIIIPARSFVVVTERSKNTTPPGKFVRVSRGVIADGEINAEEELGWTAAANLTDGCSDVFSTEEWSDQKGSNACWDGGRYIGAKILVNIVGVGGQMEQITLDSLGPYTKLKDAAAQKNITIGIESGFRTYQKQQQLFDLFQQGKGNLAAAPGRSNHQHGQAFDLNTRGFDGNPVYDWLKKNGPRFGFIRTVNKEHWHWEYRPDEAATLAKQGKFALAKVKV